MLVRLSAFAILILTVVPQALTESEECSWDHNNMPSAVVFGATGAIGSQLWQQLAQSGAWWVDARGHVACQQGAGQGRERYGCVVREPVRHGLV